MSLTRKVGGHCPKKAKNRMLRKSRSLRRKSKRLLKRSKKLLKRAQSMMKKCGGGKRRLRTSGGSKRRGSKRRGSKRHSSKRDELDIGASAKIYLPKWLS